MPHVGETWYWLSGSVEYNIPFLLSCFVIFILTSNWISEASLSKQILSAALAALIAFVVTGFNEFIGLLLGGTIAIGIIVSIMRRERAAAGAYCTVLVVVILGIGINIFAPGTAGHAATFSHPYSFLRGFDLMLFRLDVSPLNWFFDARLIFLSLLLLTSPWFVSLRPDWSNWELPWVPQTVAIPIVLTIAVFGGFFLISYAQGTVPPPRILNILYAIFIIGLFLWLVVIGGHVTGSVEKPNTLVRGINIAAGIFFPISLIMSPTMILGITELRHVVLPWERAWVEREEIIRKAVAAGATEIPLKPIGVHPSLFFWGDLDSDYADWKNECYARFYGTKRLFVSPRPEGFQ